LKVPRVDYCGELRLDATGKPAAGSLPARLDPRTGYLHVDAVLARSGLLVYSDGVRSWTEYRSADELRAWAPSFASTPYTAGHPAAMVDSKTWVSVARGVVVGPVTVADGEDGLAYMRAPILITDAERVAAALRGEAIELSIGFLSNVVPHADGIAPDGTRCDASQTDGEGNHVAGVERGRAGPACRLVLDGAVVPHCNPFAPDLTRGLVTDPAKPKIPAPRKDAPAEVDMVEVTNPGTGETEQAASWLVSRLAQLEAMVAQLSKGAQQPPAPAAPQPMAEAAGMPAKLPDGLVPSPEDEEKRKAAAKDAAMQLVRAGRLGLDPDKVAAMDAAALTSAIETASRAVIAVKAPRLVERASVARGDALAALVDAAELLVATGAPAWREPVAEPIKPPPVEHADAADDPDTRAAKALGLIAA
jgi:hypothetical protein